MDRSAGNLLTLVNHLDREWHGQAHDYEREAITRFAALLTLPARLIAPDRPARLLREATILRNARFTGRAVTDIFFHKQNFTEVDAILFDVGSPVGHLRGGCDYVVEVERKFRDRERDYYKAMQRAREVSALFDRLFGRRLRPVVIFEDRREALSYRTHQDDVLFIPMSRLVELTETVPIIHPDEIPGRASDKTMVKLSLLWLLARRNPYDPRAAGTKVSNLIVDARRVDEPVHLPVVGHVDLDRVPRTFDRWLRECRNQSVDHAEKRLSRYFEEMEQAGLIDHASRNPTLTRAGGDVVLAYTAFLDRSER